MCPSTASGLIGGLMTLLHDDYPPVAHAGSLRLSTLIANSRLPGSNSPRPEHLENDTVVAVSSEP